MHESVERHPSVPPTSSPALPGSPVTLRRGTWGVEGGLLLTHTSDLARKDPQKENVLPAPTVIRQQQRGALSHPHRLIPAPPRPERR